MASDKGLLPHPSALPTVPVTVQQDVLTRLFEHSERLQSFAKPLLKVSHSTYVSLIDDLKARLVELVPDRAALADSENKLNVETLNEILMSHPRLGEKRANLSSASAAEQAKLQSTSDDDAEAQELERLNKEYETRFFGLRYLVFVNGRTRPEIFVDMRRRIQRGDAWQERMEGVTALCDIAKDRVASIGVAEPSTN